MSASRWRDERGLTLPIIALIIGTLVLMVSFAVDLGLQRSDRRLAQAGADVVALDMMRIVEGRTLDELVNDPAIAADVSVALSASATRNGFSNEVGFVVDAYEPRITNVVWGTLEDDEDGDSFVALDPDPNAIPPPDSDGDGTADLDEVPTAVQVTAERTTNYFFQPGDGNVTRLAIATHDKSASALLGTRLVSVSSADAALLNQALTAALCESIPDPPVPPEPAPPAPEASCPQPAVNASALDYEALIGATIDLDALAAELGFGSPDELAEATVGAEEFFLAAAQVMENQGNAAGAQTFRDEIAPSVPPQGTVGGPPPADSIFRADQGGPDGALSGSVDAFSLLLASAYAINGTNTIVVPSLSLSIPGITSSSLGLAVTERARIVCCRVGSSANARQVALSFNLTIDAPIGQLPDIPVPQPPPPLPPIPPLPGPQLFITGSIPLVVELAGGLGTITGIDCGGPGGGPRSLQVSLSPRPITSTMTMDLSIQTDTGVELARASGVAASAATQGTSNGSTFQYAAEFLPNVGTGTMRPANPTSLGLSNAANVTTGNLSVNGQPVGAPPLSPITLPPPLDTVTVDPDAVTDLVNAQLNTVLAQLDAFVANDLATQLGLQLGGADIGAINMSCRSIKLVG